MELGDPMPLLQFSTWWGIRLQCKRPRFDPWVGKTPWRREWQHTPNFLPGKFLRQRSLEGCGPWGCNESDTTKQLTHSLSLFHIKARKYSHLWGQDPQRPQGGAVLDRPISLRPVIDTSPQSWLGTALSITQPWSIVLRLVARDGWLVWKAYKQVWLWLQKINK